MAWQCLNININNENTVLIPKYFNYATLPIIFMGTCLYLLKHNVSTRGKLRTLFIFRSMGIDGMKLFHEIFW